MRRLGGVLLIVFGVALALLAARARTFPTRLPPVEPDAPVPVDVEVGNAAPFAPFTFAIVGPVEGDHATLARILDLLAERGDVEQTIVMGPVTGGWHAPAAPLAEVVAAHRGTVVFVAGGGETPTWDTHDRIRSVLTFPDVARVTHNECRLVGASSGARDVFPAQHRYALPIDEPIVLLSRRDDTPLVYGPPPTDERGVRVALVSVPEEGKPVREVFRVVRGHSLRTLWRDLELRYTWSLVRNMIGFVMLLVAATALAFSGVQVLLSTRRREDEDDDERSDDGARDGA